MLGHHLTCLIFVYLPEPNLNVLRLPQKVNINHNHTQFNFQILMAVNRLPDWESRHCFPPLPSPPVPPTSFWEFPSPPVSSRTSVSNQDSSQLSWLSGLCEGTAFSRQSCCLLRGALKSWGPECTEVYDRIWAGMEKRPSPVSLHILWTVPLISLGCHIPFKKAQNQTLRLSMTQMPNTCILFCPKSLFSPLQVSSYKISFSDPKGEASCLLALVNVFSIHPERSLAHVL